MMPSPSIDAGHLLNGRYRVEALVAARPGTTSFTATDLTCGERVSIQVHAAGAPGAREWLLGGVAWAQTLSGPHIARILDAGTTPAGEPWVVREHVASASAGVPDLIVLGILARGALPFLGRANDIGEVAATAADARPPNTSSGACSGVTSVTGTVSAARSASSRAP